MNADAQVPEKGCPRPIVEIAAKLGLSPGDLIPHGSDKAKVDLAVLRGPRRSRGVPRMVLVSAITPTPAGEGKTTTTIGLGQAFGRLGRSVCLALREPSLGPCMGIKGGATGGGESRLLPADSINLHFTGDFHAVTTAHNLLAAILDNHIHHDNPLGIDPRRILWRRVIDMNDRALRDVVIGLGGVLQGVPRETGFDITAASEVMAMLCLAEGLEDLRERLERTLVAYTFDGRPVTAGQLQATGAMLALLKDALLPNLVQTLEGTPALVHGGPFANIAHGCNSVLATRLAMHCADWTITEAGFGFDLGAEKFFDIKCVGAGLDTSAVVLVATVRALKSHGGAKPGLLAEPDPGSVEAGLDNLEKHVENIAHFCEPPIVALNRFAEDSDEEIEVVRRHCAGRRIAFAVSDHFARGGEGALDLARVVIDRAEHTSRPFCPLYDWSWTVERKILTVAQKMYGARGLVLSKEARRDLRDIERLGYDKLPVCIAKTPKSLSDDPALRGRPTEFDVGVQRILINAGAGFLVVMTGEIVRMPGLPERPQAERIDVRDGRIVGLA
ncbi:MAG: formate--tetrahydrofolate ligase [Candidatus Eisenbacteria bacterium]|uniref:Formate--tetrahydrofolate ligase n=1 Tax=Eiseniibacteriota bacterium TaxID=2212470 RepID=A0A937XBN0_UNCEI|nr:formate--tetrahydrofolate ligase [Candidatus Eisenbacteria bacterium]